MDDTEALTRHEESSRLRDASWAAERLGVTKYRVWDLVRRGILPHVRLGRQVRFDAGAVERFIERGGQALSDGWREDSGRDPA